MILSGLTIRELGIITPFCERTEIERDGRRLSYGCSAAGYDVRAEFDSDGIIDGHTFCNGDFALASTIEYFKMPHNVVGIVHDKSSWARRGIAVQNTVLEPGWEGHLTLELSMHGRDPLSIRRGDPVAQVIFHYVDHICRGYDGKYQYQGRGPQDAR